MLRTCLWIGSCALVLTLSGGNLFAQDGGSGIVFTGCPPYVEGNHCDSMYYGLVAVDMKTGRPVPGMKYFLVSGPGAVNEKTGLWVLHPERDSISSDYYDEVEIAAYKGNHTTTGSENCRFEVRVYDQRPRFSAYCGAHVAVLPGEEFTIPVELTDEDWCDDPRIDSVTIQPEPNGSFSFDMSSWSVTFKPDIADEGSTFEVRVYATSGSYKPTCRFWFDVFQPEPVKFHIASVELADAQPGDTVLVDLNLDESSVDFDRVDMTIGYDGSGLQLVDIQPGPEFFSEATGCGWGFFDWSGPGHCVYGEPTLVRLRGQAVTSYNVPDPPCLIPDSLPATFATLKFVIKDKVIPGEQFAPISFYWCDCHDNYLVSSLPRGRSSVGYFPSAVFSPDGELIPPDSVPGYSGATDECYYYNLGSAERYRLVEFQNGGVKMTVTPPEATYAVRIGHQVFVFLGTYVDVPITLEEFDYTEGLGGFDLLIGYNASALGFQMATEGALYDSCGWEYFTYRFDPFGDCGDFCPTGILRLVGIAETNFSPLHPNQDCATDNPGWVSNVPTTLATMRFLVTNDPTFECYFVPLRFFWIDCGDNALTNQDGSELYLSRDVFELGITTSIAGIEPFPTFRGSQQECFASGTTPPVNQRMVDFYNGGAGIVCGGEPDVGGDINVNGIAYEIADAVMFSNYFVEGLAAFGNHVEGSIAASDANKDGLALTVEDFVYMVRVIVGDALPPAPTDPSPNPATFIWNPVTGGVDVSTLDELGGVYLIVEGEITPQLLADQMEMKFGWDTGWTRILVYSMDAGRAITSGEFLRIHGATGIVSVEAATYDARAVTEIISGITDVDEAPGNLPLQSALHPNYPNPFNPSTTIQYDLPEQARVRITVHNMLGQVVRTLVDRHESPGQHETIWDGRDESGRQVSSGLYLYRMTAGDFTQSRKMLLLK